jgi:gliding motility-associated-like protein
MASSQETGYNLNFETGSFLGWIGGTGLVGEGEMTGLKIIKGRQTIMKNDITDSNTCGMISVIPPGEKFSARLGNDDVGNEAETLSYALDVTELNALFIYKYAVVLQDPNHETKDQPYFKVSVFNESRELIDPACGVYNVIATSDIPGFQKCEKDSVVYKDWTTVGLNLSQHIGQLITIEFETGDCARGGHYGYAYVQAYSSSLKINASYCTDANGASLTAPIGFSYLWETGETTQTIKVKNPIDGTKYACQLTSVTGCKVNISTVLTLQDPVINFEVSNACDKKEVAFKNTTLNDNNTINAFQWDFGDGATSSDENPTHIYSSPGKYNVTFSFSNTLGCKYSKTHAVKISSIPKPNLIGGAICVDANGKLVSGYTLDSGLSNINFKYKWFLNDKLILGATNSDFTAIEKGKYSVLVTDTESGCDNYVSVAVELSKTPTGFKTNLSDDFANNSYISIVVIGGTGPFFYQLDDNKFQESNNFNQPTSGNHRITIKDVSNCTLLSKEVTILDYPNFFTPNNDGYNDYWNIPNYNIFYQAQISIFDRFGKLLKKITPLDIGWDGISNGVSMPATDYWFVLNYTEKLQNGNLESKIFKSHFSLKR